VTADTKEKSFEEHIEDYLNNIIKLHDFFALLPDETKREYELYIGEIIKKIKVLMRRQTKYYKIKNIAKIFCIRRFTAYASITGDIRSIENTASF